MTETVSGYAIGAEALLSGLSGGHTPWPGWEDARSVRAETAAIAAVAVTDAALACLRWRSESNPDQRDRALVWGVLMVAGARLSAESERPWKKGVVTALAGAAIEELRLHDPRKPWSGERRRAAVGMGISAQRWSATWGARYAELLRVVEQREAEARWALLGRR